MSASTAVIPGKTVVTAVTQNGQVMTFNVEDLAIKIDDGVDENEFGWQFGTYITPFTSYSLAGGALVPISDDGTVLEVRSPVHDSGRSRQS